MNDRRPRSIETLAVHAGDPRPQLGEAVATPIFLSSTYLLADERHYDDIRYTRLNNTPNHEVTAAKVAALEGTEAALLTSSGMAAITCAILAHVGQGDHVIAQDCLYGGTRSFLEHHARALGIETTFVDLDDATSWERALRPTTRLLYCESTTNPLLQIGRLDEAAAFARAHGLTSAIDNTFPSPVNFRPAAMGFDVVLHSATKYLGGHSDLIAGAACGSADRIGRMRSLLNHLGGCLDPHAAYLLHRGLKTLPLRVRAQCANALALATALSDHPGVAEVRYPGLASDPSHGRAKAWFAAGGAMVTITPAGGPEAAQRLLGRLTIPLVAPSLGSVETLVIRPASSSHAGLSVEGRAALGIRDEMIRISMGIENADDLIADFRQALA